jgi:hypothetical protein
VVHLAVVHLHAVALVGLGRRGLVAGFVGGHAGVRGIVVVSAARGEQARGEDGGQGSGNEW